MQAHAFTAQDRALEIALQSAHVVAIDASVSTDPADYIAVEDRGMVRMIARRPQPVSVEMALTVNGRTVRVHCTQDEQRVVHHAGVEASGIALVRLAALDLFGLRFAYTRARDAAGEIQAWLEGDGKKTDVGVFITVIEMHIVGLAASAAHDFEERHNPFPDYALAA